ncbi:aspartyl/glutamyl-tRNA(Asn/Gln) amidotransferase, subunit A [Mycoplasma haemofelis Ohio2]|uniref:Aspartyl/glutamyl-tRNA(Asn/Gln) amidotransferase, subunit A n=1 Tax=Mycoplasma haemofelis (strain Ohio2) TaxID=859194 RepID=F6FHG1_MYCHI|nr:aspartyl/glutamyl-tRNA(Asn/Gln) amidotransferase, subunit A [Mycoplasma haemofelis Ohio2]
MNSLIFKLKKPTPEEIKKLYQGLLEVQDSNSYIRETLDFDRIQKQIKDISWSFSNPLLYSVYGLKDLISNTETQVTGGSKFLIGYTPPISATVYKILKKCGSINLVNTNLDEFGLGGTGLSGYAGEVRNPNDEERIIGGSSSGSAYLIAKGLVDFSIASDTGDSARFPASCTGIYGFKPSYGMISRYGFFPFCSQMDTPSIMASSLETIAAVFSEISVPDPKDLTTLRVSKFNYLKSLSKPFKKPIKIAVFKDLFPENLNSEATEVKESFSKLLKDLSKVDGIQVQVLDFNRDLLSLCSLIYSVVAWSESISNYANLTGLLFPFHKDTELSIFKKQNGQNYEEILLNNRKDLGDEFVFRQMMGMYFLDGENYEGLYLKSKKLISLINLEMEKLFKSYDLVLSPTTLSIPPLAKEVKRGYRPNAIQNILLLANFCSLPAISIPWIKVKDMPVGLHIMAAFKKDEFLLMAAKHLQQWTT